MNTMNFQSTMSYRALYTGPLLVTVFLLSSISGLSGQDNDLHLTFLGTAGWIMSNDEVTVLVDPYISRVKLGEGPSISPDDKRKSYKREDYFESDTTLINSIIDSVDFILVHHSHFDHLSDVPYIAAKTGAKIIGTETTCNILRAYGIPDVQLVTVKGGEDYQFDEISVRVIPSLHSALRDKLYFDSRTYTEPPEAPLRIMDFIEGGSLNFLVRFDGHTVLTAGSMNFIEREVQGIQPDIIMPGVNYSRLEITNYTERLMRLTNYPKIVIPVHWDNFRIPYGFSQEIAMKNKIEPFLQEMKVASAHSKVIVPVHLETITIQTSDYDQ